MAILGGGDASQVNVKIKVTGDTADVDKTRKAIDAFERDTNKAGNGLLGFNGIAAAAKATIIGVGVAATAAGAASLKSAADFEQSRIGIENMLGSADAAREMLDKTSKFAAETPFQFPELAGSIKQLLAFGFSGEDAYKTMTQLGDVSAAIGAPIGDLSYLMGTLRAQGRAFTVDIRQFASRGIPVYEYLAKVMNVNTEEINNLVETGKVGFPEVQKAFEMMTAEGGKFHGTMAKQSKSLSGLWSTLQDNIGQAARELIGINTAGDVAEGSVFDFLRDGATGLIEVLPGVIDNIQGVMAIIGEVAAQVGEYLGPKVGNLISALGEELLPILEDLWHGVIEPLIPVLGTALVIAIGAVVDIATGLVEAIGWLYQEFQNGNPIVLGLAGTFGTLAAAMAFNAVFNAMTVGFNVLSLITIPKVMAEMTALKVLITTPMVMPAIAVGAAIAALALVYDQAQKTKQAVDEAVAAQDSANKSNADAISRIQKSNMPSEWKARKIREISSGGGSVPGFATGVRNFSGGLAVVGERGPELVNLPKGSDVYTNQESKQMTAGSQSITIQNLNINTAEAARAVFDILDRDAQFVAMGLTPSRGQHQR